jgi:hypothetical protein
MFAPDRLSDLIQEFGFSRKLRCRRRCGSMHRASIAGIFADNRR